MPKPSIATVADAIVSEMNGRTWTQALKAERVWLTRFASADLKTMQVTVTCGATKQGLFNRGYRRREHVISLVFRMNVNPANADAVDSLAAFVETVADYWGGDTTKTGKRVISGTSASVEGVETEMICSPEDLDNQQFFSVVNLAVVEVVSV